jgi:hypothetical protein
MKYMYNSSFVLTLVLLGSLNKKKYVCILEHTDKNRVIRLDFFSSSELKAQLSYSDYLFSVCLSDCL